MSGVGCRHWIGSDAKGHRCGAAVERFDLCAKHFAVDLERTRARLAKEKTAAAQREQAWLAKNAPRLPAMRVQLERAEAEYARRTASPVADRAAVGGAMHPSIVRAQRSVLSDSNVSRVVELQKLIAQLRRDITRAAGVAS